MDSATFHSKGAKKIRRSKKFVTFSFSSFVEKKTGLFFFVQSSDKVLQVIKTRMWDPKHYNTIVQDYKQKCQLKIYGRYRLAFRVHQTLYLFSRPMFQKSATANKIDLNNPTSSHAPYLSVNSNSLLSKSFPKSLKESLAEAKKLARRVRLYFLSDLKGSNLSKTFKSGRWTQKSCNSLRYAIGRRRRRGSEQSVTQNFTYSWGRFDYVSA